MQIWEIESNIFYDWVILMCYYFSLWLLFVFKIYIIFYLFVIIYLQLINCYFNKGYSGVFFCGILLLFYC